ncbi:glycosyltransferase family 4 protein [Sphingobium sp. CCH11-B1]|jgi:glycosyltransferase involved in cell wall biosynthesis|uniref:glycosyltransferase family 4 protein n=1 Tax=Sphingobium sp. CCH11-B1 TaxID=1768781 RepID=UPI00082C6863|nr:glycosyltransferase family 4 protein [Sphingobium sp. CCH11-B1]MEA3391095.1 glycosyltransferase family 4 protein [Pseudomonadota bacterium]
MKIAMLDPSLFTGRYDDGLCAAMGQAGARVTLLGRPMRDTDAILPQGYRYVPYFFRVSEALRRRIGEGRGFRLVKAAEYGLGCALGDIAPMRSADIVHVQWLPLAPADAMLLRRLKRSGVALVHTVHNADAYHDDAGVQGRGYRALLDLFDALVVHGDTTRAALVRQGVDDARIHVTPHPPMRLAVASAADLAAVPAPARPRLLFFGTIRPYKGVDLLIGACIGLWRSGLDFELALVGKPFMDVAPLVEAVAGAGFADRLVTEFGFLTEPRLDAHIVRADIIAFPYRQIDSSGAFLSALHHGKAMVTSDAGMFGQLPDGVAARTQAGNAAALGEALLPLIESAAIRREAGARARAYGETMGSWKDMGLATIGIYQTVLAGRA